MSLGIVSTSYAPRVSWSSVPAARSSAGGSLPISSPQARVARGIFLWGLVGESAEHVCPHALQPGSTALPIGSLVVSFRDYLIGFQKENHKKELLRSLWVVGLPETRLCCLHWGSPSTSSTSRSAPCHQEREEAVGPGRCAQLRSSISGILSNPLHEKQHSSLTFLRS